MRSSKRKQKLPSEDPQRGEERTHHRRRSRRGSWAELIFFLLIGLGVYLILALLGISWAGEAGCEWGKRMRETWGGALLVPLLFWIYLCMARLARSRVPHPLGQILGTVQLYLSLALMLGIARHTGWNPGWALSEPGTAGMMLARFFLLNLGAFGAILASAALFLLAAFFFGWRAFALILSSHVEEETLRRQHSLDREQTSEKISHPFDPAGIKAPYPSESQPEKPEDILSSIRRNPVSTPFDPLDPANFRFNGGEVPSAPSGSHSEKTDSGNKEYEEWLESFAETTEPQVEPPAQPQFEPKTVLPPLQEKRPVPEAVPILHEPEGPLPFPPSPEPEPAGPQRSAVQILDDLLSSIEAGEFSLPEHLMRPIDEDIPAPVQEGTPVPAPEPSFVQRTDDMRASPCAASGTESSCPSEVQPSEAVEDVPPAAPAAAVLKEEPEPQAPEEQEAQPEVEPAELDTEAPDPAVPDPAEAVPEEVPEEPIPGAGAFPPPLDIFGPQAKDRGDDEALAVAKSQGEAIIGTLKNFGVEASVAHIVVGPSVIQFQIQLAPGTKVNRVSGLTNELTMALAVVSVRVEAPIPGLPYVGIEIPNSRRRGIPLRAALEDETFQNSKALLPLPMGMQVDSRFRVCGLEEMPHLLVAGTTGSGKSVFVNACILGMCSRRTPSELKLILIDPKQVEFAIYEGLPHLMARPVSDPRKAIDALAWAVQEMESRMASFARAQVRTLASFNEKVLPKDRLPNVVVVVDELADLMYTAGKEVEGLLVRLAQKARAAGIHLILATQRPSVDVITGLLKNNVPARVAFAVPSQTDSRTILDGGGADKLLGRGDMLFLSTRYRRPLRLQSPFITEERTLDFVNYMKNVFGEPEYVEFADSGSGSSDGGGTRGGGSSAVDDPKMEEAIHAVMEMGITSASGLQRLLSIGYPKAGRLITAMEQIGILGPQTPNSTKPRDILMDEESAYEALERARTGGLFDES